MTGRFAIVTVSSNDFALGSAVALSSFRHANRWFDGDAVVVATDLSDDQRALIEAGAPAHVRAPSAELTRRIDALCDEHIAEYDRAHRERKGVRAPLIREL